MSDHTLTELYELHVAGKLDEHDRLWIEIQDRLHGIAADVVRQRARELYGYPRDQRIEGVANSLLAKFIRKRYRYDGKSIDPVLYQTAYRDLMSEFRSDKSVTGFPIHGTTESTLKHVDRRVPTDMFLDIRVELQTPKFPEHILARDAVLIFFLTNNDYPGPAFLHQFGLRSGIRNAVYNASVVEINRALISKCRAA